MQPDSPTTGNCGKSLGRASKGHRKRVLCLCLDAVCHQFPPGLVSAWEVTRLLLVYGPRNNDGGISVQHRSRTNGTSKDWTRQLGATNV